MGAWLSLPRRVYLDTSTLQKLYDFGGEIFEDEPFQLVGRAARVPGLADEIGALQMIFMVNERAMFGFVVTEASLREVVNRTRPGYTQWVYDVLGTWLIQSEGEERPTPGTTFEDRRFESESSHSEYPSDWPAICAVTAKSDLDLLLKRLAAHEPAPALAA